jgi:hypothetical protein
MDGFESVCVEVGKIVSGVLYKLHIKIVFLLEPALFKMGSTNRSHTFL